MSFLSPLALLSPAAALLTSGGSKKPARDPNTVYSPSLAAGASREPTPSLINSPKGGILS